jgi:monoamine oxidase
VFRPVEGFCSLITTLVNRIGICPKCHIHESHRVVSVERAADALRLNFEPAPGPSTIAVQQVTADKVIFALPRRALELIEFGGVFPERVPQGRTAFLGKLAGVNGIPAFKLCVVYDQPWWQAYQDVNLVQRGWNDGYAVTDLPLRQVFFGLGVGSTPADNQRVLLASYADTQAAQYWTGQAQVSDSQTMLGSNSKFRQADPGNLTEAINRQLSQLLQINGPLPEPLAVGYMDWSADPFGGGWHEWNPGVDIMTAIPDMRHPIADAPIYVCGEAYSWYQSWIEGALMSAERMLQDHFQLSWPVEWLPTNYDLGP